MYIRIGYVKHLSTTLLKNLFSAFALLHIRFIGMFVIKFYCFGVIANLSCLAFSFFNVGFNHCAFILLCKLLVIYECIVCKIMQDKPGTYSVAWIQKSLPYIPPKLYFISTILLFIPTIL